MKNSLRAGAALIGLSMVLASCGSGVAPDGSGSLRISDLRTEYQTSNGTFVACDNTFPQGGGPGISQTSVAVSFSLAGTIDFVDIGLRGSTTSQYDGNYNTTVQGSDLAKLGGNNFKTIIKADSANNQFLPQTLHSQGIVVNPVATTIKIVIAKNRLDTYGPGAFYVAVAAHTSTGAIASGNTSGLINIPVYSTCDIQSDTGVAL